MQEKDGAYIVGRVQNVPVSFLIDSGATVSIISPSVYEQIPIERRPELTPAKERMSLANGEPMICRGSGKFCLEIDQVKVEHSIWVAEINTSGILGFDFLCENKCCLDFATNKLLFQELPDTPYEIEEDELFCRVASMKTTVIPPESEALVYVQFVEPPSDPQDGVLEPTFEFVDKYEEMLMAKAVVNSQAKQLVIRVINTSTEEQKIFKGMVLAEFEPVSEIKPVTPKLEKDGNVHCNVIRTNSANADQNEQEIPDYLQDLYTESCEGLTEAQSEWLKRLLIKHKELFAKHKYDLGYTELVQHEINVRKGTRPIKQAPRRLPIHQREIERQQVQEMIDNNIIEESTSPWASNCVLVKKKSKDPNKVAYRFCLDFRQINLHSVPDSFPMPRIDDTLDRLSGAKYFSTLDLQNGFWQVSLAPESRPLTAINTSLGLYQFRVLPFGLSSAPASFSRLMEKVLRGLHWKTCLIYLDDVIVFSSTFEEALERLDTVFARFEAAGLKLNPSKCALFRRKVSYLGHVVSEEGIATDPDKIAAIQDWPTPRNLTELRSFLGTCSYYRKFIRGFSHVAKPLYILTEKNRLFLWNDEAEKAFKTLKDALTTSPILAYPTETDEFLLDCDASNTGIGSVLSQVQENEERVISYYSRSLNKPERQYCVTRKELLAIVDSVKHFHHYLLGQKFTIRTDHGALRWLINFKNPEAQVARWIEVLGSYQYDIQHRPGRYHGNADGLSRRPCEGQECTQCIKISKNMDKKPVHVPVRLPKERQSVSQPGEIRVARITNKSNTKNDDPWFQKYSNAEIRQMQLDDPELGEFFRYYENHDRKPNWSEVASTCPVFRRYWEVWEDLAIIDAVLYKMSNVNPWMRKPVLVLPCQLRKWALSQLHDERASGHFGQEKTLARVRERYFWVGYYKDVLEWIKLCPKCIHKQKPARSARPSMMIESACAPMERVGIDILGPFPKSEKNNRFILCIGDFFTKWITAIPLPNQEAATVADALIEHVISLFGVPRIIHSDQGSNFESKLFQELCRLLGIKKTRNTSFRPCGNGFIERFNRTLQHSLAVYTSQEQTDWDSHLPYILLGYRSAIHSSTGFTPNELMYGWNVKMPIDMIHRQPTQQETDPVSNLPEYVHKQKEYMHHIHDEARVNNWKASNKQKTAL